MTRTRTIGFGIETPTQTCTDKKCPFHGLLKVRGKQFTGKVVSHKMQHSALVEWTSWKHIQKYERYKKIKTKIVVHNPTCIDAKEGDIVKIAECRPLSKVKNFVILHILGKAAKHDLEKEAKEQGKYRKKIKEETEEKTKESRKKGKAAEQDMGEETTDN
jgi:small subunit ribosomal protein S17